MTTPDFSPIPLEELPPEHLKPQRTLALITMALDTCQRCKQRTPVLRIEQTWQIDGDEVDVDATVQFCPMCLEQLARIVRERGATKCALPKTRVVSYPLSVVKGAGGSLECVLGPVQEVTRPDRFSEKLVRATYMPLPNDTPAAIATNATRGDVAVSRLPLPALAVGQSVSLKFVRENDAEQVVTVVAMCTIISA